jgi:hypothetical protein
MEFISFPTIKAFFHWHSKQLDDRFFILHVDGSLSPVGESVFSQEIKNVGSVNLVSKSNLKKVKYNVRILK